MIPTGLGKILSALTYTIGRRAGLSAAILSVVAFGGFVILQGMDTEHLQHTAREQAEMERAGEAGMGAIPFKEAMRERCHTQFANRETADTCFNSALYGDFGEVFDKHYQRQRVAYVAGALVSTLAVGLLFGMAIWLIIDFVFPLVGKYRRWLVGK